MRATKEVVRQKIIAARDLIKCHPLTPELATELFTSKGMGVFRFSAALIEWSESELNEDVSKKIMLAGLNRTFDEWLCDSFVELIEEMELWKWDDATRDFWSRLAKV